MARGRAVNDYKDYEYYEDNVDPAFRPGLSKLITKLRELSILKDRDDSVEYLIGLIAHRYFVFNGSNPEALWRTINKLMLQFMSLAGGKEWLMLQRGVGTGGNEEAQLWAQGVPRLEDVPEPGAGGEAPAVIRLTPQNTDVNFKDKHLKVGVEGVLIAHAIKKYGTDSFIICSCKREYQYT